MKNIDDYFDWNEEDDDAFDGIDWNKLFSSNLDNEKDMSPQGEFEDENMDDFMEFNDKMKDIIERLERVKFRKMLDENYENIKKNGIDINQLMKEEPSQIARLVETLEIMKDRFLAEEEYEKMAVICPILDKIVKKMGYEI
jgi:vacuolar-type H+-ATPase subunit I/STV1